MIKPGNKSTEFLLTILFVIAVVLSGTDLVVLSMEKLLMIGAACGIYTGGRSVVKAIAGKAEMEAQVKAQEKKETT